MPIYLHGGDLPTTYIEHELSFLSRVGPLFQPTSQEMQHTKDPCPVYDGKEWHIFGTGHRDSKGTWHLVHALSNSIEGPWREVASIRLGHIPGECVAAPGVTYDYDEKQFHMFIQTTCFGLGGQIMHLVSQSGDSFAWADVCLESIPNTNEAGIYDSHPAIIDGEKYLVYSGMSVVGRPDIYLAKSSTNSWYGPWERKGCVLQHNHVIHHNQLDHHDYEWGLEGAQVCQLSNGLIILNAVCFLPEGARGTRQRLFLAVAKTVSGPYVSLGPVIAPSPSGWESGENGHGTIVLEDETLYLFYQAKEPSIDALWRYGLLHVSIRKLQHWISEK